MTSSLRQAFRNATLVQRLHNNPRQFKFDEPPLVLVAVLQWLPYLGLQELANGSLQASGPLVEALDYVAQSVNFRYRLVKPPTDAWGVIQPDGSYDGMIGFIQHQKADISLSPFIRGFNRSRVVDFSEALTEDRFSILYQRPGPEVSSWTFLYPFEAWVWASVLGSYLLVCLIHYLHQLFQIQSETKEVKNILLVYFRPLVQQGVWRVCMFHVLGNVKRNSGMEVYELYYTHTHTHIHTHTHTHTHTYTYTARWRIGKAMASQAGEPGFDSPAGRRQVGFVSFHV
ncbi:glutamate receptor ionotropic, delta-2-like [Oratosquilla oratoria]|uniref:glutamate receptor ionotropic, delta-2-like n=1 Tax=Oratosquilla oratoria TaxID=337810 RepID=UPI003F76C4FF